MAIAFFVFPFMLLAVVVASCQPQCGLYWVLRSQEGPFEHIQAAMYLGAFALSAASTLRAFASRDRLAAWLFTLFSLGAFFVFAEELAWGQTLLGFETSEFLKLHNHQGETTLHNLNWIDDRNLHHWAFMLIGLYGSVAWLARPWVPKQLLILLPPWFLSLYFLPAALWYSGGRSGALLATVGIYGNHQETPELLLATGVMLMAVVSSASTKVYGQARRPSSESKKFIQRH
jgi:hypothetical protein